MASTKKKATNLQSLFTALGFVFVAGTTSAQDFYVSGSVGLNNPQASTNQGRLLSGFTTGTVTGFTPPVTFPVGDALSWTTGFTDGETYALAVGYDYKPFRIELALNKVSNKVGNQANLSIGGRNLSAVDAGVLRSDVTQNLGIDTLSFLSGGGNMDSTSLMLNLYYDFDFGGDLNPFVAVGIGNAEEEVVFDALDRGFIRDKDNGFAWQLIGGFEYEVDHNVSFFGQYRWFQAQDPRFGLKILPASLDVENQFQAVEIGLRFTF